MATQHLPRRDEFQFVRKLCRSPQVENHRGIKKKARTSPYLLTELEFERRIAQSAGAHHHDGEERALHEITRHPKLLSAPGA